jgi:carbamoyltransferase
MPEAKTILGLSCYYHDAAAAIVRDGEVIAAAQEERFDRAKYSSGFPVQAINFCLQQAGISAFDLDYVGFYEKPYLKFARVIIEHLRSWPRSMGNFLEMTPSWLEDRLILPLVLRRELAYQGPVLFYKHHLSHAASAFLVSPFEEAAILTVDGIGEWASASYGVGRGSDIRILREIHYPHSLGLLYAIVTTYLGFPVFVGEGKVMALAAYGEPAYREQFARLIDVADDGSFRLDPRYFAFNRGRRMYRRAFEELLGPAAPPGGPFEQRHLDVAATLQAVTEDTLVRIANHVHEQTGMDRLCLAGGVFLNVMANTRVLRESPFQDVYIHPAAGDAGGALGVASYIDHAVLGTPRRGPLAHAYLGPQYATSRMRRLLINQGATFQELDDEALCREVARRIADGQIVAWFQGRMEWGPRALGNRSILADCRRPDAKDVLNERVKHREWFRPYGVSVLEERAGELFDLDRPSPYMLLVGRGRGDCAQRFPSAFHVDGTSRLQTVNEADNPLYYRLLSEFERQTGVPLLINTSFNLQEPIVCTPEDAFACFARADLDALALGPFLVDK